MLKQHVWIPHEELIWYPVLIADKSGGITTYEFPDGSSLPIPDHQLDPMKLDRVAPSSLDQNLENLINLDEISEAAVIHQLRERYSRSSIYTSIGSILVSINPYQSLNIYSSAIVEKYKNFPSPRVEDVTPHVFAVAADAYSRIKEDLENQAILISGESGAGNYYYYH